MIVQLQNIKQNPHRDFNINPLNEEKIEKLVASIKHTSFWNNLLARKQGETFQLAYGHHRLEALKRIYGNNHSIDLIVRELNEDDMLKIMMNENADWFGSSANKHEAISSAKKLYPEYNNIQIAELLNINKDFVSNYNNISKAIEGNYLDKNIIKEVNNYNNLSIMSNQVIENKIEKKDVKQIYKRAVEYSKHNKLTNQDFDNAFKDIQNERTFLKKEPKTKKEEERFIELHQLIAKAKASVFDARVQVQTIIELIDSIKDNKEKYRAFSLARELKEFIRISQPILNITANEIENQNKTKQGRKTGLGNTSELLTNQI